MLLVLFIGLLFVFSLVSGRLEKTIVTAPIIFTSVGMLVFPAMQRSGRPFEYRRLSHTWRKSASCCCSSPMRAARI